MDLEVKLTLEDGCIRINGETPQEVLQVMTYWHMETTVDPRTYRRKLSGANRELFTRAVGADDRSQVVAFPGFAYMVKSKYEELGYNVKIYDHRTPYPKSDVPLAISALREYQIPCACHALVAYGGIIQCPTGWGKTHMMGAIIKSFKFEDMQLRGTPLTVVITPGRDLCDKNYQSLKEILEPLGREVGCVHSNSKIFSDDVLVITPGSFKSVNPLDIGLLLYDEVHTLTTEMLPQVNAATRAMRFGMSASPEGRSDGADLVPVAAVGPVVYRRTYNQAVEDGAVVPVKVFWVDAPKPEAWPSRGYQSKEADYRNGLFRNDALHKRIAEILKLAPADDQALCVVDKVEHMNNLIKEIEGDVTYVHGEKHQKNLDSKGFLNVKAVSNKERKAIYNRVRDNEIKRIVSTGIYRVGVDFPDLSILINAEGMASKIIATQLPGRASRVNGEKQYAIVIDFIHRWDKKFDAKKNREKDSDLLRDAKKREKVYGDLGFEQVFIGDDLSLLPFVQDDN